LAFNLIYTQPHIRIWLIALNTDQFITKKQHLVIGELQIDGINSVILMIIGTGTRTDIPDQQKKTGESICKSIYRI
jgi:hypothetical protein